MGKRDELIARYAEVCSDKCGVEPDMALLSKVTIGCGPSIYDSDASTVAGQPAGRTRGDQEQLPDQASSACEDAPELMDGIRKRHRDLRHVRAAQVPGRALLPARPGISAKNRFTAERSARPDGFHFRRLSRQNAIGCERRRSRYVLCQGARMALPRFPSTRRGSARVRPGEGPPGRARTSPVCPAQSRRPSPAASAPRQ